MPDPFVRMALLYGSTAMERLRHARVAVFGIGGVGGYAVEALARSGIGALDLIDHDRVSFSNLNRQIIATRSSLGRYKVEVAAERIRDINPDCRVRTYQAFFLPETAGEFDFLEYDYVVDAVDTVTGDLGVPAGPYHAQRSEKTGDRAAEGGLLTGNTPDAAGRRSRRTLRRERRAGRNAVREKTGDTRVNCLCPRGSRAASRSRSDQRPDRGGTQPWRLIMKKKP